MLSQKVERWLERWTPGIALDRAVKRHNLGVLAEATGRSANSPGYRGGRESRRRKNVARSTQREDTAVTTDYRDLSASAMDLYRNDPLTRSIVDVTDTYMGESRPNATTSDPAWNKLADDFFNDRFWGSADARRRPGIDYGMLQSMFTKWCWVGGDMLFQLWDRSLLPYEGTQIQTPNQLKADKKIVNGVRVQSAPPWLISHYYIVDPGKQWEPKQTFQRIRQSECIFAPSKYWRPAMLRAVPDLHAVIDALGEFDETNENVQSRVKFESGIFTIERKGALGSLPGMKVANKDATKGEQVEYDPVSYGARFKVNGDPEHDFKFAQMQNPHSEYVGYMEFMARLISAGVGIPYEVVMHIYTNGSYTANRAARLDFAKFILNRWAWRNKVLNQRVWNWRIAAAIKDGDLPPAPANENTGLSEWHMCAWTLPHFPHIDEGKEVLADIKQWGCGQESMADWAQQKGQTRDQLLDSHDLDVEAMQKRADKLKIPLELYMGQLFTASAANSAAAAPVAGAKNV